MPYYSETLVSALSKKEILGHLIRVTREVNYMDSRTMSDSKIKFNGMIGQEGFRISKVITKGDTFLPLIKGEVEPTPRGSIIFMRYRLFPGAIFFLAFWSVILIAFSVFYLAFVGNLTHGLICIGLAISNYVLGMFFFHRQVKASREVFHELINFEMKGKD